MSLFCIKDSTVQLILNNNESVGLNLGVLLKK